MQLREELIAILQKQIDSKADDAVQCKGFIGQLTLGGDLEIQANYLLNPDDDELRRAKLTASQLGCSSTDSSITPPTLEELPKEAQEAIENNS